MKADQILQKLVAMHPNARCELKYASPFELLVAVILSAQCTDKVVNTVTEKLFKIYNTPQAFAALTAEDLKPYIYSCGLFNNKAKNIIAAAKCLIAKFNGNIPNYINDLTSLDGVGRKTALVVLAEAFKTPAFPVDTHVFRVSNRLGIASGKTPDKVEEELRHIFKREDWIKLHHLFVFHGRYICTAENPKCDNCKFNQECKFNLESEKLGKKREKRVERAGR